MRITKKKSPIFTEECDATGLHPAGYYFPPERFVEPNTEGRLIAVLRDAALSATENTLEALANAIFAWLDGDTALSYALAELCVTGKQAFQNFKTLHPTDSMLIEHVNEVLTVEIEAIRLADAVVNVLDRAYEALWTIRDRSSERRLDWIAVWAEVDQPHRPVNVPATTHTQYDLNVNVQRYGDAPARTIQTRFAIFNSDNTPTAVDYDTVIRGRELPVDPIPVIAESNRLLFYVHGHSSRLEEGEKLGTALSSSPYTLISIDLPCNAYAEMFDHVEIAPSTDTDTLESFPLLDFIEQFVVDAIRAIGTKIERSIENQIVATIGGSLGGNINLRLARRDMNNHPWLNNFVAWSAASVWTPYTGLIREAGPNTARARMNQRDYPERRQEYIRQVFDDSTRVFGVKPQGDYWYRDDGWEPCKTLYLRGAREDRREIYNENFRRWHWRVALEQMLFSHRAPESRVEQLRGRTLFLAAEGDDYPWTHIQDSTRDMAMLMVNTPGKLSLLKVTGHSIHDERPMQLAREINIFLPDLRPNPEDEERWTGWIPMGGITDAAPVIATHEDGRLEVFIVGDNNKIWHNTQTAINSGWRNSWAQLRGGLSEADRMGTAFAVERNWDGRLEVFAHYENENWIAHVWQNEANGSWNNWDKGDHIDQLIGGATNSTFAAERYGEAPSEAGEDGIRLDVGRRWLLVGAILTDGRIHVRGQNNYGWWTNGKYLGEASISFTGTPFITRLSSRLLIIFARDDDNRLWSIREETPDHWQANWQDMGFNVSGDVTACLDARGRVQVVGRSTTGRLSMIREVSPGGDWGSLETEDVDIAENAKVIVTKNPWGELQIFIRSADGSIHTRRQILGLVRRWTAWTSLGGNATIGPVVAAQENGMLNVFYVGTDRAVYRNTLTVGTTREITAVRRSDGRITHLCNEISSWSPMEVETVINEIEAGERNYFVRTADGNITPIILRQILTTRADDSLENNLSELPMLNLEDVERNDPPEDNTDRRITHILKFREDSFNTIRGLYNQEDNWYIDRLSAFHEINNETHRYYFLDDTGNRNYIIAREYLTTRADDTTENNLSSLPDC